MILSVKGLCHKFEAYILLVVSFYIQNCASSHHEAELANPVDLASYLVTNHPDIWVLLKISDTAKMDMLKDLPTTTK